MENITLAVIGITEIKRLVLRFSKDLPATGVAWRDFGLLSMEKQQMIEELTPDTNANGKPKARFATQYVIAMEDIESGRKYLYDVKVTCFEGGDKPWSMYIPMLERLGPKVGKDFDLEAYFKLDDMFVAKLKKEEGEKYWHLNLDTLERA
jgi:hypothetical protein